MFVDLNVALKWALFGDEAAKEELRTAGVSGRGLRSLRHGNRTRRSRRTDFARGRRRNFFGPWGRSLPTTRIELGLPFVFGWSMGDVSPLGTVHAIDYGTGEVWVTP